MAAISMGTNFPPELVKEMMNQVVGHSSLARLSARKPIPFTGEKIFTFSLDKEADIVAENGAKSVGGATLGTVNITPIKLEYSARVSDEFMRADEEYQLNVLEEFAEGAAKKFARALDLAAFHGVNPRTNTVSKMPTSVETTSQAYVGDFANAFRWGYATEMPVEVIPYGNPDNDTTAGDLKGHNQVLLRLEAFIGWGILDPDAFAVVQEEST